MSTTMASGSMDFIARLASAALAAVVTTKPADSTARAKRSRISGSFSTTRTWR